MKDSVKNKDIYERTFKFALDVIKLIDELPKRTATFVLGDQVIRSACSMGANLREAKQARSKKEFISSFGTALKEAEETIYWLSLIKESKLTDAGKCDRLIQECEEIINILATIILKAKRK